MNVALLEFADEYEALRSFAAATAKNTSDFKIVALQPKLRAHLAALGVPYVDTTPYFDNESHCRMIHETERAMRYLGDRFAFSDRLGARQTYLTELRHYVRLYLNHFYEILEVLRRIDAQHPGSRLFASHHDHVDFSVDITVRDRFVGPLAARFAAKAGLRFTRLNPDAVARDDHVVEQQECWPVHERIAAAALRRWIRSLAGRDIVVVQRRGRTFAPILAQLYRRFPRAAFIAVDHAHRPSQVLAANLLGTARSLAARRRDRYYSLNLECLPGSVDADDEAALGAVFDGLFDVEDVFAYDGIDCRDLVKAKAQRGLKRHVIRLLSASAKLGYVFDALNAKVVLSYSAGGLMSMAGEVATLKGRPSLIVSHGTHPPARDEHHEIELINQCRNFMLGTYSHAALCLPVHEDHLAYFKARHPWIVTEGVKTGNLIFPRVSLAQRPMLKERFGIADEIVVTHAVTIKLRGHTRFHYLETPAEFVSSLCDLVRAVDRLSGVRLILRLHPGSDLTEVEIRRLLPASPQLVVSHGGPFGDVLGATDVLVGYSSTTIEEALLNHIPVLLYDKWGRYNHCNAEPFVPERSAAGTSPVWYVGDSAALPRALAEMAGKASRGGSFDYQPYSFGDHDGEALANFVARSFAAAGSIGRREQPVVSGGSRLSGGLIP